MVGEGLDHQPQVDDTPQCDHDGGCPQDQDEHKEQSEPLIEMFKPDAFLDDVSRIIQHRPAVFLVFDLP